MLRWLDTYEIIFIYIWVTNFQKYSTFVGIIINLLDLHCDLIHK